MAQYTAIFTKPYEDGYENLPSQNTPITAETLNDKDDAIVNIETYLSENDIPSDAEGLSYDNTDSGLTADNVQGAVDELADEKVDKSSIGTEETGATASKAYTVGEHFLKDEKFCTAIASIASGGTFTLNTNYVEGDISKYLNVATGELTVNSDFTSSVTLSGGRAYRSGNLVRVQAQISVSNMTSFSGSSKTIINVPWRNVNFAVFGQINKSSDNYEMITETGFFMSNGGGGLRLRKSLPDGSYYINIDYLTTDPI